MFKTGPDEHTDKYIYLSNRSHHHIKSEGRESNCFPFCVNIILTFDLRTSKKVYFTRLKYSTKCEGCESNETQVIGLTRNGSYIQKVHSSYEMKTGG